MNNEGIDFAQLLRDISDSHAKMVKIGMEWSEDRFRPAISVLEREFFAAQLDPETKMSTTLTIAICNVLALAPTAITDKVNNYAEAKIKSDQLARHAGRADHDMTTHGTRLRAGT